MTADTSLNALGVRHGVEFRGDYRLGVPANRRIGARFVESEGERISVTTSGDRQGTLAFAGNGRVTARIGSALATSGVFATPPAGFFGAEPVEILRLKQIDINGPGTVIFGDGVGAHRLHFNAAGTAALDGPAMGRGDRFHQLNVSTANRGQGTLRFGNRRAANVLGNLGATAGGESPKPLKQLILTAGGTGPVRLLGSIEAEGIALNGRALTLGNGLDNRANPFGTPVRGGAPYTVGAPITTHRDGTGRLNIKDFNFDLQGAIGRASNAQLAAVNISNARASFEQPIYARAVTLSGGSTLAFKGPRLTIAGSLALHHPAPGSTLALRSNTLTVNGALDFHGAATHTLALTLDGATGASGDVQARSRVTLGAAARLKIQVRIENASRLREGQSFTVLRSGAAITRSALARMTVSDTSARWNFDLRLSLNQRDLILIAKRVQPGAGRATVAANERGDLALVPYYTVWGEWVTGLHIVNTSNRTQVVKLRFRRATDALNALDFIVVLAPHDVYAGFLSDQADGVIAWSSPDRSCTIPAPSGRRLAMPEIYRAGAQSGYVEVIAMGSPSDEQQPMALAARPVGAAGTSAVTSPGAAPLDCAALRSNFFADGRGRVEGATTRTIVKGVQDPATTWQSPHAASPSALIRAGGRSTYEDSGNVLKVSYFLRDNATGTEFGDNAVHIRDFLDIPAITNQQYGVVQGDVNGFDFPDLNGGVPLAKLGADADSLRRGRFNALRARDALGVSRLINEWSTNPANGVAMNWVVTLPGQYAMLRLPQYAAALASASSATGGAGHPAPGINSAGNLTPATVCPRQTIPATGTAAAIAECDYRDLPIELAFTVYDRESHSAEDAEPQSTAPATTVKTTLPKVANVIAFGGNNVFGSIDHNIDAGQGQPYGWVGARVTSRDADIKVCDWDRAQDNAAGFPSAAAGRALTVACTALTNKNVPVIGFAAWSRRVAVNPDASYGRIVEHSYRAEAATPSTTPSSP